MDQMKRFAIYYAPRGGAFADAAASWLGWDARTGSAVAQPDFEGMADWTAEPRRYGFHGTIKPPFRLADGITPQDLCDAVARLAQSLRPVTMPGLTLADLGGFLALIPAGDTAALAGLAGQVVHALDPFRAPLTPADIARRRPERLSPRQRALLAEFGYPYVMEEFQFHLTLSGKLTDKIAPRIKAAAAAHFTGNLPAPFVIEDLCLFGEDEAGRFHLLQRYPLSA
jgi:putative phosphonate metabolism protein